MRFGVFLALMVVVAGCVDRGVTQITPSAAQFGTVETVHVATLREPDDKGWFGRERADALSFAALDVAIPEGRELGKIRSGFAKPNPQRDFAVTARRDVVGEDDFIATLRRDLAKRPPEQRDVTLYVHGYNNSYLEGIYRAAQLRHDFDLPGLAAHFAWPSAANPLGYTYDRDSALFARDGLEQLLKTLKSAGAKRVVVIAHSLGTMLVMETLRQIDIRQPGWSQAHIDGVILIAPDLDVDLFRVQADRIAGLPQPFAIFVNNRDRALQLSARINGSGQRLGNIKDPEELGDYPVTLVDVSAFSKGIGTQHFTLGTSPALIQLIGRSAELNAAFQGDRSTRSGLLPGTVITMQKATQLILSPHLILQPD